MNLSPNHIPHLKKEIERLKVATLLAHSKDEAKEYQRKINAIKNCIKILNE